MEIIKLVLAIIIALSGMLFLLLWRYEKQKREYSEFILGEILKKQGVNNASIYRLPSNGEMVVLLDGKEL